MLKIVLIICFQLALVCPSITQPATEIYLFDLKIKRSGITISNPRNISNNKGYDNQPFFHPEKPLLYYSSADTEGRTDIVEYNYQTKQSRKLTTTREREYSPTVTPDHKFISCIIQRDSGQQDLGKYPIGGGEPEIIIDNLIVGYHAWADLDHAYVFVLGEPNTLRLYSVPDKKNLLVTENIGRSIHRLPGTKSVSFIHKETNDHWLIKKINENDGTFTTLGETLKGQEFLTWTSTRKLLMSDEKKIFYRDLAENSPWKEVTINSPVPLKVITRLAINSKDSVIAIVMNE